MKCHKCESDNTQRLEVVYKSGTQNISTQSNSVGLGFSGGRIGVAGGLTKTSGQTQSTLAVACSPPSKKPIKEVKLSIGISIISMMTEIGLHWWTMLFLSSLFLVFLIRRFRLYSDFNLNEWPKLYQNWSESWLCHKCGYIYQQKYNSKIAM